MFLEVAPAITARKHNKQEDIGKQMKKRKKYVHLVLTLGRKDPGGHTHAGDNHQADDNTPSARARSKFVSSESRRGSATEIEGLEH